MRQPAAAPVVRNAFTIDVEDYFQVSAFAPYIARADWAHRECRVEANVDRILAMLARHRTQATFFTLGWIAERYPQLVRRIVAGGHELASHGHGHERASDLTEDAFFADVDRAKRLLEDVSGVEVLGYRAPSFSIGHGNLWAFDVLARAGYRYSSSIYPIRHDHYGMPDAPRFAHRVREGLLEIPPTTLAFGGRNWPASGGGYFRLLPYAVSRRMLQRVNQHDEQGAVFYFHPWEIDPDQPRIEGIDLRTRFRHYVNIDRMQARLERLLSDFAWGRMDDIFLAPTPESLLPPRPARAPHHAGVPPLPLGEGRGEGAVPQATSSLPRPLSAGPHPNPLPEGEGTGLGVLTLPLEKGARSGVLPLPLGEGRGEGAVPQATSNLPRPLSAGPHPNPLPAGEGTRLATTTP